MGVSLSYRPTVHSPDYRTMRGMPLGSVSTALSCSCTANNSNFNSNGGRYIYYLISAAIFVKFDTWTQTSVELTAPPIATATWATMEYADNRGFEGRTLAATSSTITIPASSSQALRGYEIEIVSGTGAGQKRFIVSVAEPTLSDNGVVTAITNTQGAINVSDSTKAWTVNQWAGYECRISSGSGVGQVRRIIYNSSTELFLGDSTKSADDAFCNPAVFLPAISAAAGLQSNYVIESSVATVNANWGTTPDTTSRFRIDSGGIFLMSSAAATPFYTMQYYDVLFDTWYIRSANELMQAVVAADGSMEHSPEAKSIWQHNLANGTQSTTTLQDLLFSYSTEPNVSIGTYLPNFSTNWTVNQWTGYNVFLVSGTGAGQIRTISSNTPNTLTVSSAWTTTPDATSEYMILGYDAGLSTGTNSSTTINDTGATWGSNAFAQYAVRILFGTGSGQVRAISSNTTTALTVLIPWTTTPDSTSVYVIIADPDKMITITSNNTCLPIYNIEDDMLTLGRLNDSGTAAILSVHQSSQAEAPYWRGSYKPQAIATITFVTTTATVTTVNAHNFVVGESVTIVGATGADASKYNGTFTIASVASITTFTYTMGSTPASNAVGSTAQSTTTLTDAAKAWTVNQWAGFLVTFNTSAQGATTGLLTMATALISSNTASTLTVITTTAPVSGQARYVIHPKQTIGTNTPSTDCGAATSGSTTTLVDTTKTWVTNIYAGNRVKITGGTGQGQEFTVTSNTSTTLTFTAITTAPAANSTYAIMQQSVRGAGTDLLWADNGFNSQSPNAQYCYVARGGAAVGFDRFDLTTDVARLLAVAPNNTTLTTGSQYAYDGKNRLYFTKIDTAQQRLYYIDLTTYQIHGGSVVPFTVATALAGNRMEIIHSKDGIPYLWIQPAGQSGSYLVLLFW